MKIRILNSVTTVSPSEKPKTNNTELHATRNHIPLIARILLSALFIVSGINKIMQFTGTQQYMANFGMPLTGLFLIAAIIIEVGGGLSLLLGYYARLGATALAIFMIPATFIFHSNFTDQIQQIMFMKNLAILGGLLMIIQFGSGSIALRPERRSVV